MASNYTGNAANATNTLSLMTGADRRTAQSVRVPLERLLDNDAAQNAAIADVNTRYTLDEDFCGVEIDADNDLIRTASGIWSVVVPDGSIAANVSVEASEASAPGVLRFNTNASDPGDSVAVTYGEGGDVNEQLHSGMFAAPGSYLEIRFRLLFGSTTTSCSLGLYEDEVQPVLGSGVAARVVGVTAGSNIFSFSSQDGSDTEVDSTQAIPVNEWVRVRFKSVDALLDTTEIRDDAGALLATVTHTDGILDANTPLHLGWLLVSTSTSARFVDVDRVVVHANVPR